MDKKTFSFSSKTAPSGSTGSPFSNFGKPNAPASGGSSTGKAPGFPSAGQGSFASGGFGQSNAQSSGNSNAAQGSPAGSKPAFGGFPNAAGDRNSASKGFFGDKGGNQNPGSTNSFGGFGASKPVESKSGTAQFKGFGSFPQKEEKASNGSTLPKPGSTFSSSFSGGNAVNTTSKAPSEGKSIQEKAKRNDLETGSVSPLKFTGSTPPSTKTSITGTTGGLGGRSQIGGDFGEGDKTLGEVIGEWSKKMDEHSQKFSKYAHEISLWDDTIRVNGDKIDKLKADVDDLEKTYKELSEKADFVEQKQRDLQQMLDRNFDKIPEAKSSARADVERHKTYTLMEEVNDDITKMSNEIRRMIGDLNSRAGDADSDSTSHIMHILNSHLNTLLWVNSKSKQLDQSLNKINQKNPRDTNIF